MIDSHVFCYVRRYFGCRSAHETRKPNKTKRKQQMFATKPSLLNDFVDELKDRRIKETTLISDGIRTFPGRTVPRLTVTRRIVLRPDISRIFYKIQQKKKRNRREKHQKYSRGTVL